MGGVHEYRIFIFDGVEELDFVGPWEVFTMVNTVLRMRKAEMLHRIYLVSENGGQVICAKGMRVASDFGFANAPQADIILVEQI